MALQRKRKHAEIALANIALDSGVSVAAAIRILMASNPNVPYNKDMLKKYSSAENHQTLIIDMGSVDMVDLTGIYALEDLITLLQKKNTEVYVTQIDSKIESVFEDTGFFETIGRDYFSNDPHTIFNAIDS